MPKKNKIAFGKLNLLRNDILDNQKKIRIGFVGGGPNSFIGYTHRLAARFDNRFDFKAGIFSLNYFKVRLFHPTVFIAGIFSPWYFKWVFSLKYFEVGVFSP